MARPSTDRLREALFSILSPRVVEARVLDLFAGSGALGVEALSRGAAHGTFVDRDRAALTALHTNLERTGLAERAAVVGREVLTWLTKGAQGPFDLVFADPPYVKASGERDWGAALLSAQSGLEQLLSPGAVVILETGDREPPSHEGAWRCEQGRRYGNSHLHFFSRESAERE